MFSLDPHVIEFVRGNWISLMMALTLIKGIAKLTPTVYDDKIVTLLRQVVGIGKPQVPKK